VGGACLRKSPAAPALSARTSVSVGEVEKFKGILLAEVEVEQDEVGGGSGADGEQTLGDGGALGDDVEVRLLREETAEAFAKENMVIEEDNANAFHAGTSAGAVASSTIKRAPVVAGT
jgi:hypothetical protein